MKYVAHFEYTGQVTEDSWKVFKEHLEVDGSTTIDKIREWAKKKTVDKDVVITISTLHSLPQ